MPEWPGIRSRRSTRASGPRVSAAQRPSRSCIAVASSCRHLACSVGVDTSDARDEHPQLGRRDLLVGPLLARQRDAQHLAHAADHHGGDERGVAVGRDLAAGLAQRHHPLGQLDHLTAVAGLHRRDVGVEVQVVHDDPGERIGVVERHVQLGATALPLGERAAGRRVDLQGLRAETGVEKPLTKMVAKIV